MSRRTRSVPRLGPAGPGPAVQSKEPPVLQEGPEAKKPYCLIDLLRRPAPRTRQSDPNVVKRNCRPHLGVRQGCRAGLL